MKGYRINPNKEHVETIIQGLIAKNGYCPCKVIKDDINICITSISNKNFSTI